MRLETSRGVFLVRPYAPGDEELICRGFARAFGKALSPDFWRWKYRGGPAGFAAVLCFAPDGRLAVHYAGQFQPVRFFGERLLALHLCDAFTHPAFRFAVGGRQSLFARVARIFWRTYLKGAPFTEYDPLEAAPKKADFVWGLPGYRHFRLGEITLGYGHQRPALYAEATAFKKKHPGRFSLSRRPPFPPEEVPVPEEGFLPCTIIKDAAWFTWRYLKHPAAPYLFFGRRELGLLVLKGEEGFFTVVDFFARDPVALWELLSGLRRAGLPGRLRVWLSSASPAAGVFLAAGFKERPEPLGIVPALRGFFPEAGLLAERFSWVMGDADLY